MVCKCKICAGSLTLDPKSRIAICDYCGTKQVLPLFSDESVQRLYDRGNNYLLHNEYDKAENLFSQLLSLCPQDPEIYWDLVLCKYGVTFVKDPATDKYIPTCNRTHFQSVFQDENYKKALEYSDEEKKAYYKENAATIDNIQRGILSVSKKEKPFDIFISYKETDTNGARTKDSVKAQELYDKLTEAGYKAFFSRITLEDKVGTEYEPYIYAALYSSKVMLTICSSKDNIEAAWVKNEWSRFLTLRQNDAGKTLIPLYYDMQRSDLPEEFAILSAQDMSENDFEQELLRGIKKLIPLPIMKAKRRKQMRKTAFISAAVLCVAAIGTAAILLPGYFKGRDYSAAMAHFENAEYEEAAEMFAGLKNFRDSEKMLEKCSVQPKYDAAMQLYYDGNYPEAAWAFCDLGDYEDAQEQKEKSELSWRKNTAVVNVKDGFSVYQNNDNYYIDYNGSVSSMNGGIASKNLSLQEHGKIVSLGMGENIAVVHEDGYVSNIKLEEPLTDVIKISGEIATNSWVVLHTDGSMSVAHKESSEKGQEDWDNAISKFTNIVDFEFCYEEFYQGTQNELIVAIKSDGSLCGYCGVLSIMNDQSMEDIDYADTLSSVLSNFSDIKCLKIVAPGTDNRELSIVALTNDGKLQTYINGTFSEREAKDVIDVVSVDKLLTSEGKIVALDGHKVYAQDVVFADTVSSNDMFYISRAGLINGDSKHKATVQTEWVSRLD